MLNKHLTGMCVFFFEYFQVCEIKFKNKGNAQK